MADEAEIITLLGNQGDPVEYTILNGSTGSDIPKGSLMQLSSSPQTVTISSGDGEFFAGILAVEHVGGKGVTKVALITHCVALLTAGTGATTFGVPQKLSGENLVIDADDDTVANSAEVVGMSVETVADGNQGAVIINL